MIELVVELFLVIDDSAHVHVHACIMATLYRPTVDWEIQNFRRQKFSCIIKIFVLVNNHYPIDLHYVINISFSTFAPMTKI